jgi:hypothetical protein
MGMQWPDDRLLDEGMEPSDSWVDDPTAEDERPAARPRDRRDKYVARRNIERYWELKALRSHLDEFDTVDSEF